MRGVVISMVALTITLVPPSAGAQMLLDELAGPERSQPAFGAFSGASGASPSLDMSDDVDVGQIQHAWDTVCEAQRALQTGGVKRWMWSPDQVLCIETRAEVRTTVIFPETETLTYLDVGDSAAFKVLRPEDFPNLLHIEPTGSIVGADTVVHAVGRLDGGERNYYTLYVRSYPVHHEAVPDSTVFIEALVPGAPAGLSAEQSAKITDRVPQSEVGARINALTNGAFKALAIEDEKAGDQGEWLRSVPFDVGELRFDQWSVCPMDEASEQIAPRHVFNDSRFVFLDYGEEDADIILRGAVHRVVDEVDNPANFRVTGPTDNIVVVEHMGYDLVITNGKRVVCIRYRKPC